MIYNDFSKLHITHFILSIGFSANVHLEHVHIDIDEGSPAADLTDSQTPHFVWLAKLSAKVQTTHAQGADNVAVPVGTTLEEEIVLSLLLLLSTFDSFLTCPH